MTTKMVFRCACMVAAVSLPFMSALGLEESQQPSGSLPVIFPVMIDPPIRNGGQNIKSGEAIYEQELHSIKAVRIDDPYVFKYAPRTLDRRNIRGGDSAITIPAGTVLMQALTKDGEMYCTAATEGDDSLMTFYDVGYCARDTDNDGIFDKELVIEQTPWRVRVAYEILNTGAGAWREATLPYKPLLASAIPALHVRFTYNFVKPGGLFSFGKPRAYYYCWMSWPEAAVLPSVHGGFGSGADFNIGAFRSHTFNSNYGTTVSNDLGAEAEIVSSPFDFKLHVNPDKTIDVTVPSSIAPGPAALTVAGRYWTIDDYRHQGTIMRVAPMAVSAKTN